MQCLVFVKFLPGGSLSPEEFLSRINAQWSWFEEVRDNELPRSALCITDYESIEQLTIDLSIMPGAGISNVEVLPVYQKMENDYSYWGARIDQE